LRTSRQVCLLCLWVRHITLFIIFILSQIK